jgi:hypothetical protein
MLPVVLYGHETWFDLGREEICSYSFLTSALDRGSGQRHAPAALYLRGKDPPVPIGQKVLVSPRDSMDAETRRKILSASVGDRTPVVQSVVSHYTD